MRDISNLAIEEAFAKFINVKKAMNRAEDTIKYYEDRFMRFNAFLKDHKNITTTNQLEEDCIIEYVLYLKELGTNSDNSINNYLRAVRAMLYYFMEKSWTEPFHISLLSVSQTPKDGYSDGDLQKLIKKPDIKKCTFPQYRNWVIVCHFLASANRLRTLRYIKICHVNLSERIIALKEVKNREGYEMPISDEYYPIIKEYMEYRGGEPDDFLFCNQFGKQLTSDGLKTIMNKYNRGRGVDKTGVHIFKNNFAKTWLLEGGSVKKLQHALGHKSSKMVDEYARLYGRELREEFSKFTPLAKLKDEVSENKKIRMKKAKS